MDSLLFIRKMGPGRAMNRGSRRTARVPIRFPVNTGGLCTAPKGACGSGGARSAYSAAMRIASDQGSRFSADLRDARNEPIKAKSEA